MRHRPIAWGRGVWLLPLVIAALLPAAATAQPPAAVARIESQEFYLGESVIFQIDVQGSDSPQPPDLSAVTDFATEYLGGQTRNQESITIVNGRMSRTLHKGYAFTYRLTPRSSGDLVIPALQIVADGATLTTNAVPVRVKEPAETEDFKLRMSLSRDRCYVGEPVTLTVTWYIGRDARNFQFTIPILDDGRFRLHDPEVRIDPARQYLRVQLSTGEVIAEKGQGTLDDRQYATLTFRKVLVPSEAGRLVIPRAAVACEAVVGYGRSRDLFDDFFSDDFFGLGRRGVYERFVAPSNELQLEVLPLPQEGRPADFAGHVGRYRIEAAAQPTEANVGDPITLTVTLSGPEYLRDVELPPLGRQAALARDFRVPEEMAAGEVQGDAKVFTQTIRAARADVAQVPPIELPYFDTGTGRYSVTRSDPIPLTIHSTRVVTAQDAEGRDLAPVTSELREWGEGIAHNYEDLGVLVNQRYGLATLVLAPRWAAGALGPPVLYLLLLAGTIAVRRSRAHPEARRARHAFGDLRRALGRIGPAAGQPEACRGVLSALREYLGSRLSMPAGALTYRDAAPVLHARGVADEQLALLEGLMQECEAGHYAGGSGAAADPASLCRRAVGLARQIERKLR
jgi:hypothetical protein